MQNGSGADVTPPIDCALRAIYNWNYDPEIDQLRSLYANALDRQWIAVRDLDWEREIDPSHAVANLEDPQQFPIGQLHVWQETPDEKKQAIAKKLNAFMLSQFLHGEQGALMVAAQLVNAVPHMDGKFYASTQTLDEARHVEVFARYVQKLDRIYPIDPTLKGIVDETLATDSWPKKLVGMQIVLEGLALASFRNMRRTTREPLLAELLRRVSHDEARHTAYGIQYLRRVLPTLPEAEILELEDFAFEATRAMIDQRTGGFGRKMLEIFASEGLDVGRGIQEMVDRRDEIKQSLVAARREQGFDADPLRGFILPTLSKLGLYNERTEPRFIELIGQNMISGFEGTAFDGSFSLPDDLETWVDETSRSL
jgi:hypothetical protein